MSTSEDAARSSDEQRWIVGVDGSDHSRRALRWAVAEGSRHAAAVEAVVAWQFPYTGLVPVAGSAVPAHGREDEALVTEMVAAMVADATAGSDVTASVHALIGPAAGVLLRAAEDADLLVVGSRGRGGFARLMLGSVGHQIVCHTPCPAVIVPDSTDARDDQDRGTVVVGVDGSANSLAALRWADSFAPLSSTLLVIGCWQDTWGAVGVDPASAQPLMDRARLEFERALDEFEPRSRERSITRAFEAGHAGERLVHHAAEADLLVLGARGRGGVRGALIGSTVTWATHHLTSPTVVVPAADEASVGKG